MTRDALAFTGGLLGGFVAMFAAFYAFFMATDNPASWLARHVRPH